MTINKSIPITYFNTPFRMKESKSFNNPIQDASNQATAKRKWEEIITNNYFKRKNAAEECQQPLVKIDNKMIR